MIGIGEIIRINRIELDITQEELCDDICTPGNLSKIENGIQVPTRATFNALMERMGLSPEVYPSFLNNSDREAYELKHDFNELYAKEEFEEAESVLSKLEKMSNLENEYRKFASLSGTLLGQIKGTINDDEAVEAFEVSIKSFIKGFTSIKLDKIRRSLLTKTELNILNAYAIAKHGTGDTETAIKVLYECITYIDSKVYYKEGIAIVYTKILYNLSKFVGMKGDDEEAIRLCELGIRACRRYNRFTYLSVLLYNKGYGLMNLGRLTESHDCIRDSFYIQRATGAPGSSTIAIITAFAIKHDIKLM